MDDRRPDDSGAGRRIRLGGIKFSQLQTRVACAPGAGISEIAPFLETCYRNRINLTQLFWGPASSAACDFCLDEQDYLQAAHLLDPALSEICAEPQSARSVGRLTLFPHNYDFSVVIGALSRLAGSGLPVYCAYSSISALSITTDYRLMDSMAESLLEVFDLPEGHSPFRYEPSELDARLAGGEGRKIETIAKYWEPVIKIYGSNLETGFTAVTVSSSAQDLPGVLTFLSGRREVDGFKVIGLNSIERHACTLLLLVGMVDGARLVEGLRQKFAHRTGVAVSEQSGLEVVYFHGPHFQDRYGVALAAVKTIEAAGVECVFLNCSGTSIFLVTPENVGSLAQKALEKVFTVP